MSFILGVFVGMAIGIFIGSMCAAAGKADDNLEQHMSERSTWNVEKPA